MSLSHRVIGTDKAPTELRVHGRLYAGGPGRVLTVPMVDAVKVQAMGYDFVSLSGQTADRPHADASGPFAPAEGLQFFDESLGRIVVFKSLAWCDAETGKAA